MSQTTILRARQSVRVRGVLAEMAPAPSALIPLAASYRQPTLSVAEREQARGYAKKGRAVNTKRAYKAAWHAFESFCAKRHVCALPAHPDTLTAYVTVLAGTLKVSTLKLRLTAISQAHRLAKLEDPTRDPELRETMKGIRRELKTAPRKKAALTLDHLRAMTAALPDSLSGIRDRALILVGFAGAFRRSELVAVDVADVEIGAHVIIRIGKSKSDQEGSGSIKAIPPMEDELCPVRALRAWLAAAGIQSGPLFRPVDRYGHVRPGRLTDRAIALVIKAAAVRAGLEPSQFAGHSLRRGFITAAAGAGVQSRDIMAQSGHKSESVMRGYIEESGVQALAAVRAAFGRKRD